MFLPNAVTSAATCTVSADYKRQSQAQDACLVEKSRCNQHLQQSPGAAPLLRTAGNAQAEGNAPLPSLCTESPSHPAPRCFQPTAIVSHRGLRAVNTSMSFSLPSPPPSPLERGASPGTGCRDWPGLLPAAGGDPGL